MPLPQISNQKFWFKNQYQEHNHNALIRYKVLIFYKTLNTSVITVKGSTGAKVKILTKDYNVNVAFMYWFIEYQNEISNINVKIYIWILY
jgi:hypothetical protein